MNDKSHPTSSPLSSEARETLNDILKEHRAGNTSEEAAVFALTELFKRNPVNYKRAYSDSPAGAVALPVKGQTIGLSGFADQNGQFTVLDVEPGDGSVTLRLEPKA